MSPKIFFVITLSLLLFMTVVPAVAWDMNTTYSDSISDSIIGKTMHIVQQDDDSEYHTITTIIGITDGFLVTSDWYFGNGGYHSDISSWGHWSGKHYMGISTISGMWEDKIPTENIQEMDKETPGFGILIALLLFIVGAYLMKRRS